ncbi:hypothetical protein D3C76_1013470 [compost metagenome]
MRAEHAQVDQRELTPHQARQQRCEAFAANVRQAVPDGRQNGRFHQRQGHRCGHTEDLPLVHQVVTAIGVARIDADLLFATEHQYRRAGDDQRPQRQQFFVLQRIDCVIRLHRWQNAEGIAFAVMQQRGTGHRQIGNAPGADQVAEIDHTLQLPAALCVPLPHHVVVGDVHVNGLYGQFVLQWQQMALGLFGRFNDQAALGFILDDRQQMRNQRMGVARVPLQGSHQPRMVKIRQCQVHFTAQAPETGHHGGIEIFQVRQGLALDVIQQTHMHRLACDLQGQQVGTVFCRDHPRNVDVRMPGQVLEPGMLGLQFERRIIAPANFQDKPPLIAVDTKIQVLLAAEGL